MAEQPPTNGTAEALRQLRDSVEKLERWQAHLGPADKLRNTLDRLDTWREESRRYWWGTGLVLVMFLGVGAWVLQAWIGSTIEATLLEREARVSLTAPSGTKITRLRLAIRQLPARDPALWTADGAPRTDALDARFPLLRPVSAAERDYAWHLERVGAP